MERERGEGGRETSWGKKSREERRMKAGGMEEGAGVGEANSGGRETEINSSHHTEIFKLTPRDVK